MPIEHPLPRAEAQRLIRRLAQTPGAVYRRGHCREQMRKRRIDAAELVRLLRNGEVNKPAYKRSDEWRYKVEASSGGDLVAVTVIVFGTTLHVHAVYRASKRAKVTP